MSGWIFRIAAVIALLGAAAAIATPKGRLPIALRALAKSTGVKTGEVKPVPRRRRLLAFALVVLAVLLVLV